MEVKSPFWAVVELMGHQKIAGSVEEVSFGGGVFTRVTVPETPGRQGYTRDLGASAIYAINHCDEETARWFAASEANTNPILTWSMSREIKRQVTQQRLGIGAPEAEPDDEDDDSDLDHDDDLDDRIRDDSDSRLNTDRFS